MEYIKLSDKVKVSRIIQGLMRLNAWNFTKYDLLNHLEKLLDLGITTLDNADIYGDYTCEERLGEALKLKPQIRNKFQIITKCGIKLMSEKYPNRYVKHYDTSKEHIINSVNQSLKKMSTDYIDILLLHRPDPLLNPVEVSEAFSYLYKSGKVLNFGVSNYMPSSFRLLQKYVDVPLVTNQIEVSPLNVDAFTNGVIELCQEMNIPPMAWGPLAGGAIFNSNNDKVKNIMKALEKVSINKGIKSLDTIIYAFILNHPAKIIPIVGTASLSRIQNAINALNIKFTREEWFLIYSSAIGREVD